MAIKKVRTNTSELFEIDLSDLIAKFTAELGLKDTDKLEVGFDAESNRLVITRFTETLEP